MAKSYFVVVFILMALDVCLIQANSTLTANQLEQYVTSLIDNHLLDSSYNKNVRPNFGGPPVLVNITTYIKDLSSLSESSMDYKVDFYIRHYWNDPRLRFPVQHNISLISFNIEQLKKIWRPDTFFDNAKEVAMHDGVDEKTTLLRVSSDGDVVYSTEISMLARCPMNLVLFPLDQQKCSIRILSYGLTTSDVLYAWRRVPKAVEFNKNMYLPTFNLMGYSKYETANHHTTGVYSRLQLDFFIHRSIGFYVSQVYIPAIMIVIISWMPFWLDRHDHHARVALGVTTVLTMTTLVTNTNSDFPKISYLKAVDIYLFACFLMVFLSLVEYATVGYFEVDGGMVKLEPVTSSKPNDKDDGYINSVCIKMENNSPSNDDDDDQKRTNGANEDDSNRKVTATKVKDTSIIDYKARRLFPLTFALFNAVYVIGLYICVSLYSYRAEMQVVF